MTDLVDHLAELTGFRDRELLDVTLVGALRDLLGTQAQSVAIYRSVGEPGNERWLTRALQRAGDLAASADPSWIDLDTLPRQAEHPARLEAFRRQAIVAVAGSGSGSDSGSGSGTAHGTLFPVSSDRESLGVLEVKSAAALDDRDRRMVLSILRIYHNFQALLDYSERDTLTGLLNRKTFDDSFLKVAAEPAAAGAPSTDGRRSVAARSQSWLGVIDIDHFKHVNDNYGHLIGDEVLLLLSRVMRASFRFHDRLYRFGGEEFVVLMRCTGAEAAALAFERLRRNVEQFAFPQVGHISISIGFTGLREADSPSAAFERADRAVYHAKGHGRNRVAHHAELVACGELKDETKVGDVELF